MIVGFYERIYNTNAKIPLECFELWEKRAVAEINQFTARDIAELSSDNANMCICEVAEILFENANRRGIESENNDGYSVRFKKDNIKNEIYSAVKMWLSDDDILFRGDVL